VFILVYRPIFKAVALIAAVAFFASALPIQAQSSAPGAIESTETSPFFLDEPERKDPFVAGLLSWSWNGLGQFYTQNYGRGSLFLMTDILQKGLFIYGLFYYSDKYRTSDDDVVRWNDIAKRDRGIIVGYLFSLILVKVLCVVDAVNSAETYNREIYFPYWKNRIRLNLSVETTHDRFELSIGKNIQF
jgi:TM2 domain-containing membrane protein YozV